MSGYRAPADPEHDQYMTHGRPDGWSQRDQLLHDMALVLASTAHGGLSTAGRNALIRIRREISASFGDSAEDLSAKLRAAL